MNIKNQLSKIISTLTLGIGLSVGVQISTIAIPNRHFPQTNQSGFKKISPPRPLNLTPRYHQPLPTSNNRYYPQRRVRGNCRDGYGNNNRRRRVRRGYQDYPVSSQRKNSYIRVIRRY